MVPQKTRGFLVSLPTDSFSFSLCLPILSSENCLLLPPPSSLAYVKHCFWLSPSASYWIHQAARSAICCLLQPLWPAKQPNLLVSFSLSGLRHAATIACCRLLQSPMAYIEQPVPWHTSSNQKCFLLPPAASLNYVKQPNPLVSFSLFWPISCSGQHEDNTVITSMDTGESTNPYTVTNSLLALHPDRLCGQLSLPSITAPVSLPSE
jgi:hypothetical protein